MDVFIVSKDFLGAKNLLREVVDACASLAPLDPDFVVVATATTITFPRTGRRIVALPCRPETIRSCTGAVICDEVAFWRLMEEVWAAAKVVAGQTLSAPYGYPMALITTPWDSSSLACRLFTDGGITFTDWDNGVHESSNGFPFIRYRTDVYAAKRDGFPIDIDAVRDELGIPELFATEFECAWTHGGESFFPTEKLRNCQQDDDERGGEHICGLPDACRKAPARLGIDCGGGKGRDFTAAVLWRLIDGVWWMTGVKASNIIGTIDFADIVADWMLDKAVVDESAELTVRCDEGITGADFIRQLAKRLRERKRTSVMGVGMNPIDQERYAVAGRRLLERGQMKLYTGQDAGGDEHGCRALMLELSQLKARPGVGGRLTFATPRDPTKGHLDRAWAGLIGLDEADDRPEDVVRPNAAQMARLRAGSRFGGASRGFG